MHGSKGAAAAEMADDEPRGRAPRGGPLTESPWKP